MRTYTVRVRGTRRYHSRDKISRPATRVRFLGSDPGFPASDSGNFRGPSDNAAVNKRCGDYNNSVGAASIIIIRATSEKCAFVVYTTATDRGAMDMDAILDADSPLDSIINVTLKAEAASKWYFIGLAIGFTPESLDDIKGESNEEKLEKILRKWMKEGKATIGKLCSVMRKKSVLCTNAANMLEQKYGDPGNFNASIVVIKLKEMI